MTPRLDPPLLAALILAAVPLAAFAEDAPACGPRAQADGRRIVDKEALAQRLLHEHPISLMAIPRSDLVRLDSPRPYADLLGAFDDLCGTGTTCSEADKVSKKEIKGAFGLMIASRDGGDGADYSPTDDVGEVGAFFRGPDGEHALVCSTPASKAAKIAELARPDTQAAPDPVRSLVSRIRVRGDADQLDVARGEASSFGAAKAATLSLQRDQVARTDTYQIAAYLGIVALDTQPGTTELGLKVIPYAGINRDVTQAFHGPRSASEDTVDVGVFASDWAPWPAATLFSLRPDYLWDRTDDSEEATLNLRATPYWPKINNRLWSDGRASVSTLADVRLDVGRYTRKGTNPLALASPDFSRLGGRAGLDLENQTAAFNIGVQTSYTYLKAISGRQDVGLFSGALSFTFGERKYVGVSLSYDTGVREDTAKKEDRTNLSLTVKY